MLACYHNNFIKAYKDFFSNITYAKKNDETILLDAANGIGGIQVHKFL